MRRHAAGRGLKHERWWELLAGWAGGRAELTADAEVLCFTFRDPGCVMHACWGGPAADLAADADEEQALDTERLNSRQHVQVGRQRRLHAARGQDVLFTPRDHLSHAQRCTGSARVRWRVSQAARPPRWLCMQVPDDAHAESALGARTHIKVTQTTGLPSRSSHPAAERNRAGQQAVRRYRQPHAGRVRREAEADSLVYCTALCSRRTLLDEICGEQGRHTRDTCLPAPTNGRA